MVVFITKEEVAGACMIILPSMITLPVPYAAVFRRFLFPEGVDGKEYAGDMEYLNKLCEDTVGNYDLEGFRL